MFGKKSGFSELKNGIPDTLIASNVKITGDISFSGGIQIDGQVEGNVIAESESDARLWVSEKGLVKGQLRAPAITINGTIEGDVYSCGQLELAPNAVVNGNVFYKVIEMAQGAAVNGSLHKQEEVEVPSTPSNLGESDTNKRVSGHDEALAIAE